MRAKIFTVLFFSLLCVNANAVRILIGEKLTKTTVTASGEILISVTENGKKYIVRKGGSFDILALPGNKIKVGSLESSGEIIITPPEGTVFSIRGSKYNGTLFITPGKNVFTIVEDVDLETYLYGVLPYEMSHTWPPEALKAQAVAARTYTLKSLEKPVGKNFDLYADVRSQMYKGGATVYASVKQAVDGTASEVLKYNDEVFYAYYHANSGGATDSLPWAKMNIKPLNGASSPYCKNSKNYNWTYSVPKKTASAFLGSRSLTGEVKSISVSKKTSSGRATELSFKTDKGSRKTSCHDFRMYVGSTRFKSCLITSVKETGNAISFTGNGYGHGTGMCQDGAKGMAERGSSYREILKNYYPGAKIVKI